MRQFLTPKWLVSHVFVLAMLVLMVNLGFWQLRRLDERKDRNAEVVAALEAEPVPIEDLLDGDPPDNRPVIVAGEYLDDHSFLVANRTFESQAGSWLVTPMRLADGRVVVVSRGWVPRSWTAGTDARDLTPASGRVEVLGRLLAPVAGGRIGTGESARLPQVSRLDLATVEELTGLSLEDRWVQLERQAPPAGDLPTPVPPPAIDEGPHLSYAFQWFFFSFGTVVAYALILRKLRREAGHE